MEDKLDTSTVQRERRCAGMQKLQGHKTAEPYYEVVGTNNRRQVEEAMKYSSECWAIKQQQIQKLQVAEMKMLRMMCGVTRKDRISNEYVRSSLGVMS